jgi:hypothetical protein
MPTIDPSVIESLSRHIVSITLLAIGLFLLWLATVIDIVKNDFKRDADKIVWFLFVMMLPPLGVLLYFFIGRFQKTNAEPVIRSKRYRDIGRD